MLSFHLSCYLNSRSFLDLSSKKRPIDEDKIDAITEKQAFSMDDRGSMIKGTKPWFLKVLPSKANVSLGEPIDLEVVIDGDPKPFGNKPLPCYIKNFLNNIKFTNVF